ncbi:MAG: ABC transporter permease [Acidobacteriota bacterium]
MSKRHSFFKPHIRLIALIGVIVPRRLRADWRQEWEAELQYRELLLADWDKLNWKTKSDLLCRSLGAFWDALLLQPRRLEDEVFQDLRYGARMLLKHKGFTAVAVLSLALGIGANTAIFSVVNAVLLRPLPYPQAGRMVLLWGNFLKINITQLHAKPAEYVDYRDQTQSFDQVAGFHTADLNLTGSGDPRRIAGARVTANLFTLLEAQPAQGRVITADENQPGRDNVAVISHGFWQQRLGGAANMIGQQLKLNDLNYTIIGVMPAEFQFPHASFGFAEPAEVWLPLALDPAQVAERSGLYAINVVARLKPQVDLPQAQAELSALAQKFEREYRGYRGPNNADGGWRITVVPLQEQITGASRRALWILFGAVGLVLLIACANVANLLLMRATARQKELGIRVALGARRGRIVRQLLVESMLLAGLGGALGLLLAWWGVRTLALLSPANLPRAAEVNVDGRALAFTLLLAVLTGLVFGFVPAWQASKPDLQHTLKEGGANRTRGRHSGRELLVIGEVALALPLLIGAGLLLNSFVRLQRVKPGVDADKILIAEINLPAMKYREPARAAAFFEELTRRVAALPGVEQASFGTLPILSGAAIIDAFSIEGRPLDLNNPNVSGWQRIAPGYFRTLGIPLVAGRDFSASDTREAGPVAIINETLARHYFPDGNALGKRLTPGLPRPDNPFSTIIGIVKDIPHRTVESQAEPDYFLPFAREPRRDAYLFVRAAVTPAGLAAGVRGEVLAIDGAQPVTSFRMMNEVIASTTAPRRFNTLLFGGFALIALLLAALGIYSVNSYAVTQRTHEIGIRMALGAPAGSVLKLVMRRGLALVLAGLGIGLVGAFVLTRVMAKLLFEVSATDPVTFVSISLLLATIALLACWIPARRATQVDPLVALRHE